MTVEGQGFIGDIHAGAMVALNGSINYLGFRRFDSDACFGGLLGKMKAMAIGNSVPPTPPRNATQR
jgi:uncharacterized protein (AIM24 family)